MRQPVIQFPPIGAICDRLISTLKAAIFIAFVVDAGRELASARLIPIGFSQRNKIIKQSHDRSKGKCKYI
jgi:hypothetical protein